MDINETKNSIITEIDSKSEEICELSLRIHAHPELAFQETRAAGWITEYLEKEGFKVERGVYDFPTAFQAVYGDGRPVIAFLAEYDALPEIGHACGHNLITAAATGALIGARLAVQAFGGSIVLIGTPAEELYAGKEIMAQRGAFKNLDAAMMVHPHTHDYASILALACQRLDVEFFGKAAHAAGNPYSGINALDAMILSFSALNALRQHLPPYGMIHGIITEGGTAANIIPDHSAANFIVRADNMKSMAAIKQRVMDCFSGAAVATGASLEYKWEEPAYAPMNNISTLCELYFQNIRRLGRTIEFEDSDNNFGSTDFGNVSQIVPGLHATVNISEKGAAIHSVDFAEAAASEYGLKSTMQAAQGLAMTAADLLADPVLLQKVKREFAQKREA